MKIQNDIKLIAGLIIITLTLSSCGVSEEVRYASANLVEKQNQTLEAHRAFHEVLIKSLNIFLDAEEARSKKVYNDAVANYENGQLQELTKIFSNNSTSVSQKKVAEEKLKMKISKYIEEAKENLLFADSRISQAKESLIVASNTILAAEEAKSSVIGEVNSYMQEKRFSEKILDYANIDLAGINQKFDNVLRPLENTLMAAKTITNQKQIP